MSLPPWAILKDDSLWIERMGDVINGELERRKSLLDRAGISEVAEYEYRRIHLGNGWSCCRRSSSSSIEFTQMFIEAPDSKKIIDEIGRQGRALNVKMILGSQRLGHEMQSGIMVNIPIRDGATHPRRRGVDSDHRHRRSQSIFRKARRCRAIAGAGP